MKWGQPVRMDRWIRWMDFGSAALVFLQRFSVPAPAVRAVDHAVCPLCVLGWVVLCCIWNAQRCAASTRPTALHDEQRMVFLVQLRIVADYGFQAHLAFRGSATIPVLVDHPQDGFPAAPYRGYPTQTFFLRGISLLVEHKCDDLAPAVWVSVCFAAALVLVECVNHPCAGAAHFLPMVRSLWGTAVVTALV